MRVLITGSAGFIAPHVAVELRRRGYDVVTLDRAQPADILCDLCDREATFAALRQAQPEAVLHLAARTDLDETQDLAGYDANIGGVTNLLDAIRAVGTVQRTLVTSSQLVCRVGYTPANDTDFQPSTLYGQSKVETETRTRAADGGGTTWCLLRPTTVWGPGMSPHYRRFLALVRAGRYVHFGRSPLYKSYGYVENTAWQYAQLLEAPAETVHAQVFYLADYTPLSLRAYADGLADAFGTRRPRSVPLWLGRLLALAGDAIAATGRRFPLTSFRLNNILTGYVFDMSKTEAACGPLPVDIPTGIRRTADWYRHTAD